MTEIEATRALIDQSFDGLEFVADSHQYFLHLPDGSKKELLCVSYFTDLFNAPSDWTQVAKNYAEKHGESAEYWMNKWADNAKKATSLGTQVHEYAESLAWLYNGFPDKICESARSQYNADKNDILPIAGDSTLARKEQAVYKFWNEFVRQQQPNLHFVMAEHAVCTGIGQYAAPMAAQYAGTFDLLLYYEDKQHPEKSGYCIFDYKTNRELESSNAQNFKKFLLPPFNNLVETSKSHYILQQSCYQIPLENIGLKVIAKRLVWLKEDGNYEIVRLDTVTDKIRALSQDQIDALAASHKTD